MHHIRYGNPQSCCWLQASSQEKKMLTMFLWWVVVAALSCAVAASPPTFRVVVGTERLAAPWQKETKFGGVIKGQKMYQGCHMKTAKRHVEDGFLSDQEAETLLAMVKRGMKGRNQAGPTILDINSGYCKDGAGLVNIYQGSEEERVRFSQEEYALYRSMFDRIQAKIMEINGLDSLYFTAPTFVARIVGDADWQPKEMHDEYWHEHVDKSNSEHYDYSGLVYLSDYQVDFQGGEFLFLDKGDPKAVLPKRGRFISFASGPENPHQFTKVTKGTRYAFSMWFSCDPSKYFKTFLDGKAHETVLGNEHSEL